MSSVIQYVPFSSFVHPSFWYSLSDIKLNVDKLNETTKQIYGKYNFRHDIGSVFEVDGTSFNSEPPSDQFYQPITGTIMNKNTIEEFKNIDKTALLNSIGEIILGNIRNKTWIENPSSILNFFVLSFADLKKFHYFYWFAFPSPSQPTINLKLSAPLTTYFDKNTTDNIAKRHNLLPTLQKPFFAYNKITLKVLTLAETELEFKNGNGNFVEFMQRILFGFLDSNNGDNPGWSLRVFVAALLDHYTWMAGKELQFIGLRYNISGNVDNSRMFTVLIPENVQSASSAGWVGWERNDKGNFGPKLANMAASMDPVKIADSQSDLNIRLMKWRLVPELDVRSMKSSRCLLLGAGTLGCHVARGLLAWGFRHITFIDNGKVSFSNPTRQVLFNYQDAVSARSKAEAAAVNIASILPTVKSKGINLHIPMPGHPIGESIKTEALSNIQRLIEEIDNHDVIFLLLDTREARWLPTLLAAHFGKIAINAALGFDSYLVMRHGVYKEATQDGGDSAAISSGRTHLEGGQLGCYFCNDVTAPGNSVKDRTLDQQCTVTRPGVAAIAGALAVEMLMGMLQHPEKLEAPAVYNNNKDTDTYDPTENQQGEGVLGPVPHSIRGFLPSNHTVTPTCEKFKQCIACSDSVVKMFRKDGVEFVLRACESGKYLEDLTGLSELQIAAELSEMLTLTDEDDEFE